MKVGNKELRVTPASFADAMELQRAVGRAIKEQQVAMPGSVDDELTAETMGDVLGVIISVAISREVEDALFKCADRALLGESKVDRDFFEDPENREYYYPIMLEIAKVNLSPFFKNLSSLFGALGVNPENFLKRT